MDITVNSLIFGILGAANAGASSYSGIILILLMIALMYFFMIRPQQKQRKQHQSMMDSLHPGDEVVTIGRLHGKVDSINKQDRTVTLDCEGIYLTFDMVAIARVIKQSDANHDTKTDVKAAKDDDQATKEKTTAAPDKDDHQDQTDKSTDNPEK